MANTPKNPPKTQLPPPSPPVVSPCTGTTGLVLKYCWKGVETTLAVGSSSASGTIVFNPTANPPLYISTIEADFTRLLPHLENHFQKKA
jgi:hypothetical protein